MTGIEATRAVYYTRRKATHTGRREIRKWARSVVWLAGFCAYTAWTAHNGLLETDPETWTTAYRQIAQNDLGEQAATCAATTAAAIWALIAAAALSWIVRRRPWRPHSGGLHLFSPVWDLPRPRNQSIRPPYFPPLQPDPDPQPDAPPEQQPEPGTPPEQQPEPGTPPEQQPEPGAPPEQQPEPGAPPEQQPEPDAPPEQHPEPDAQPDRRLQPPAEPDGGTAPAQPPAPADPGPPEPPAPARPPAEQPSGQAAPQPAATREELLARAGDIKARCGKAFNLYSANKPMRKARESLLAVLVAAGASRAKTDEVAGILRATPENIRSLMRRAEKDGWVIRESPADWALSPQVKTDIALLVDAVDNGDEQTAEAIAATIGPPLPTVTDEWLDQLIADPTPRKELRLAAAEILTAAADQWPQNPAWLAATDRLYGDD